MSRTRRNERNEAELMPVEKLRSLLDYDPISGSISWRKRSAETAPARAFNTKYAGKEAGGVNRDGYREIIIRPNRFMAHRIAWALFHGEWPAREIDHASLDNSDNSIDNLRQATRTQNVWNRRTPRTNTSGAKGVRQDKRTGKWTAKIDANGRSIHLGTFDTKEAAAVIYDETCLRLHGSFAVPNIAHVQQSYLGPIGALGARHHPLAESGE